MKNHLFPALAFAVCPAFAIVNVDFAEVFDGVETDLQITVSGTLDLAGLTREATPTNPEEIELGTTQDIVFTVASQDFYGFSSGFTSFNATNTQFGASLDTMTFAGSSDAIAIGYQFVGESLFLPSSFTGGNIGTSIVTIDGTDFSDINVVPGIISTLTFTTASNVSGSTIHFRAVPEPSTYAAFAGFAVLGFVVLRRRK